MHGDFSRLSFAQRKHYSSVRKQQGRVDLDADWNEQADITRYRSETQAEDIIGRCGAPKYASGFQIGLTADRKNLTLSPGRFYVDGLLCELEDADVTYTTQPNCLMPPYTTGASEQNRTLALTAGTPYLIYLHAWEKHLTALDDESIQEKALGGADTCTRTKTAWQVLCHPVNLPVDSQAIREAVRKYQPLPIRQWTQITATSMGQMDARIQPSAKAGPCSPQPQDEYKGLENQLYRIEIHKGGAPGVARFKWSRDNGAMVAGIVKIDTDTIMLVDTGRGDLGGLTSARWAEIVSDRNEYKATAEGGQLVKIVVDPKACMAKVEGSPLTPVSTGDCQKYHYKLRRWDHAETDPADGLVVDTGWMDLEDDLQVQFLNGSYQVGDYWLVPARMATGKIEWPPAGTVGTNGSARPPAGIEHHFAPLALITWAKGGVPLVDDLRLVFSPLNDMETSSGACTLLLSPEPGWERSLNQIASGQDAQVCFKAGTYPLGATVTLSNKGHLLLRGAGQGTRIIAKSEAAIVFADCKSITVRDLSAESQTAGSGGALRYLGGTLSFCHCPSVVVENVWVKCAAGTHRSAACIRVADRSDYNKKEQEPPAIDPYDVRIRGCDLEVGHMQEGILLINPYRATIEDNRLTAAQRPVATPRAAYLKERDYRLEARKIMVASPQVLRAAAPAPAAGKGQATVGVGGYMVNFKTHPELVPVWPAIINANPPRVGAIQTERAALTFVEVLADRTLRNFIQGKPAAQAVLSDWLNTVFGVIVPDVASAGIVVGGNQANDVRILNNNVQGALEGIHIGVSHREANRGNPHAAGRIQIEGNTIGVVLMGIQPGQRRGIFVGNCDTLLVTDNSVMAMDADSTATPADGICVYGYLGRMVIVRENHLVGFTTGVLVVPLNDPDKQKYLSQWVVSYNMAPGAAQTCEVGERPKPGENSTEKKQREERNAKLQARVHRIENYS